MIELTLTPKSVRDAVQRGVNMHRLMRADEYDDNLIDHLMASYALSKYMAEMLKAYQPDSYEELGEAIFAYMDNFMKGPQAPAQPVEHSYGVVGEIGPSGRVR